MSIPKYVRERTGMTPRQWRAHKRQQLRALYRAFSDYTVGCAYAPSLQTGDVDTIANALNRMIRMHSVKEWDQREAAADRAKKQKGTQ